MGNEKNLIVKIFKKNIRKILDKFAGKKKFQKFFDRLHKEVCGMMNFGGVDIEKGGELNVLRRLAGRFSGKNEKAVIFDVGANVGNYSFQALSIFNDNVNLYCFEPSKEECFAKLSERLKGYKSVKLHNFGFGEKNETVILYSCRSGSSLSDKEGSCEFSSVFQRKMDHYGTQMNYEEKIEMRRLDDFCEKNKISHIDLLKLDTEGSEFFILKGAQKMINSGAIDYIQFEFGACNIDSRTFIQDFFYVLTPNYRLYRIVKDGFVPMEEYKERYEIFIATNYLAVSRKLEEKL